MKKTLAYFIGGTLLFLFSVVRPSGAQNNTPDQAQYTPTNTPEPLPPDYSPSVLNGLRNFVRSYEPLSPQNAATAIDMNSPHTEVKATSVYYDGLGRELQTVSRKALGGGDWVQTKVYDALGRESLTYLPFQSQGTGGKFVNDAFSRLNNFYNTQSFPVMGNYSAEPFRYGKVTYDNSPLNRVVKTEAPGKAWTGSNNAVFNELETNTAGEVRIWTLDASGMPQTAGAYGAEALYVTRIQDEDMSVSKEYKDKSGRVLLLSQLADWVPAGNSLQAVYHHTYNIYDDFNRLRFVLPPLACEQIKQAGWTVSQTVLDELCYQYRYDAKGRMIEKKLPGKDWEYMIYDERNRVVLTQDGNLRSSNGNNEWYFTFYDQLDRPKITGRFLNGSSGVLFTTSNLRAYFDNNYSLPGTYQGDLLNLLQDYALQHYYYFSPFGNPANTDPLFVSCDDCDCYTYTFYDHYNHPLLQGSNSYFNPNNIGGQNIGILNGFDNGKAADLPNISGGITPQPSNMTLGLITGTAARVMKLSGTTSTLQDWLLTANYYDEKEHLIQTQSSNTRGNIDYLTNLYDFRGKMLASVEHHHNPDPNIPSAQYNTTKTVKKFNYLTNESLSSITSNINNLGDHPLVSNQYDPLGRLSRKTLGGGAELQDYTYNIRGWLTAINPNWVNTPSPGYKNFYGEVLCYQEGFTIPRLNGNISGVVWRGSSDALGQRSYGYEYDYVNRLQHAEFRERTKVSATSFDAFNWQKNNLDFTVSEIDYDANGNIEHLKRMGVDPIQGIVEMDNINYNYKTLSGVATNQLEGVEDISAYTDDGNLHDLNDQNGGQDYAYDANGNVHQDLNKEITSITYSYLNKPEWITLNNGNSVRYIYDALGNKLQKITNDQQNNKVTTTDYMNGHIYNTTVDNGVTTANLEYIVHEEGRIRPALDVNQQETYTYDFFVKDHLGNVRAVVNAQQYQALPHIFSYTAGHEPVDQTDEGAVFDDYNGNIVSKPASTDPADVAAVVLDGDDPNHRVATSLMLRVNPGDKFTVQSDFYYNTSTLNDPIDPNEMLSTIVSSLTTANEGMSAIEGMTLADVIDQSFNNPNFLSAYTAMQNEAYDPNQPRVYLNYLFFDDNFEFVQSASGSIQVNTANAWHTLSSGAIPYEFRQAGYIYVFHSVADASKAYADDMDFTYYQGSLLEEDHYYPFGMTISALHNSPTSTNVPANYYKYNTKELQRNEFGNLQGLEWYDYGARMQDPQLGRWHVIDPMAERWVVMSPYSHTINNPINFIDPDGEDVRVGFQWDDQGNITVNLSSTIYVDGYNKKQNVKDYNQFLQDHPELLSNTTTNEDGTTTTIQLDFQYVEGGKEDLDRISKERNGDNYMYIAEDGKRSSASPVKKFINDGETGEQKMVNFSGFRARMGGKSEHYSSSNAAFHEVMHLFGLRDWYNRKEDRDAVGHNDMMNNSSQYNTNPVLHQLHWNNWKGYLLPYQQRSGMDNFILDRWVEEED